MQFKKIILNSLLVVVIILIAGFGCSPRQEVPDYRLPPATKNEELVDREQDMKRLSDIREMQAGLESYYANTKTYPSRLHVDLEGEKYLCLDKRGFNTISQGCPDSVMIRAPFGPDENEYYTYIGSRDEYVIVANLEVGVNSLAAGPIVATTKSGPRNVALVDSINMVQDVKRLAHVENLQLALEYYYYDHNDRYPAMSNIRLGDTEYSCLNSDGFTSSRCSNPYMGLVPQGPDEGEYYMYDGSEKHYTITLNLETRVGSLGPGTIVASPGSIDMK